MYFLHPALAEEARVAAALIKGRIKTSVVDVGNDLLVMKKKLGHGRFGQWLDAEFIMSVRYAEDCMSAARFAAKYAVTAYMPPTILVALASPSADPDVIHKVMADVEAGKAPTTADVKGRLAETKAAKRKAEATKRKSPEQIAKEQKAEKRRRAEIEEQKNKWQEAEKAKAERVQDAAKFLVQELGIPGVLKFFSLLGDAKIYPLWSAFHDGDWSRGRPSRLLTEEEISVKFGGAA